MQLSEKMPVSKLFTEILAASGYEAMLRTEGDQVRLDNIAELKQTILQYEISCGEEAALPDFLAHIALFTEADAIDEADKVKLMTVHAAKGLEFPYVFLIGLNEGVFPAKRTDSFEGMEEERRLCFVAMTRAQKGLFLSGTVYVQANNRLCIRIPAFVPVLQIALKGVPIPIHGLKLFHSFTSPRS